MKRLEEDVLKAGEYHRKVTTTSGTFDVSAALRVARAVPKAHEFLGSQMPTPSPQLESRLRAAAAEIGLEPRWERRGVVEDDEGRVEWYAILDTARGQLAEPVSRWLGWTADQAWVAAFAQIGLEL